MLIISLDAVGDDEYERLMEQPVFSAFAGQASVHRGLSTIFVSNTYPIHASIVTGVTPAVHGLVSNTERFPAASPVWNDSEGCLRVKTLWQAAAESGLDTAAVFWPVTAFSKTIRYNIPEVLPRPGKSQIMTSLRAGSTGLQLRLFLRHRKLLKGISQPDRDNFATACMVDILHQMNKRQRTNHKPWLALMHLTAYDSICHYYGKDSAELPPVIKSLDRNLGLLLDAAGDTDVIILTDHSQINVHTSVELNEILISKGLMSRGDGFYVGGESGCFFECCGGSAFFHAGSLPADKVGEVREAVGRTEGFGRFLSGTELSESGYGDVAFGLGAIPGYAFTALTEAHKAEHGYPTDTHGFSVFYMTRGFGLQPGAAQGGSLLDIAPLVTARLGGFPFHSKI